MNLQQIEPIEYQGQRVMSSQQLADYYGCDKKQLRQNFNNNIEMYEDGIDYWIIHPSETCWSKISTNAATKRPMYVWTESGALMHAKSLNTEKAWQVYRQLVDLYFRVKESKTKYDNLTKLQILEMAIESEKAKLQLEAKIEQDKPHVEFSKEYKKATHDMLVRQVAKALGTGEKRLYKWLLENKVLISNTEPYQKYSHWFKVKSDFHDEKGRKVLHHTLIVTPCGHKGIWRKYHSIEDQLELLALEEK